MMGTCPECGARLGFVGSIGITLHGLEENGINDSFTLDTNEDRQADRYDCPNGHTALVINTADVPSQDWPDSTDRDEEAAS